MDDVSKQLLFLAKNLIYKKCGFAREKIIVSEAKIDGIFSNDGKNQEMIFTYITFSVCRRGYILEYNKDISDYIIVTETTEGDAEILQFPLERLNEIMKREFKI